MRAAGFIPAVRPAGNEGGAVMGFALLGIEGVAAVWLLAAAVVAGAGRLRRRWLQFVVAALALPVPAVPLVQMWLASLESQKAGSPGVEGPTVPALPAAVVVRLNWKVPSLTAQP